MNMTIRKIIYIVSSLSLDLISIICNIVILFYALYAMLLIIMGLITLFNGGIYSIMQSSIILLIAGIFKLFFLRFKDKAKEILAAKIL